MTTFDVFINGIQPELIDDIESIKEMAVEYLKIDIHKLEEILNSSNSSRIQSSVSEPEAQQYQKDLQKIGLICVYRPGAQKVELTLEALEIVEDKAALFSCPSCNAELPYTEDYIPPEKCSECGISITKFLNVKKLEEEKEKIRQDLLRTQNIHNSLAQQEQQKKEKEKLKKQLEKEIKKDNPALVNKKKSNQFLLLGGSLIVIAVIAGLSLYPSDSIDEINSEDSFATTLPTPEEDLTVASEPTVTTDNSSTETFTNNQNNSQAQAGQNYSSTVQTGQQSLQNTHDQATRVLNSFGLDADAFANAKGNSSAKPAADSLAGTSNNKQNNTISSSTPPELEALVSNSDAFESKTNNQAEKTLFIQPLASLASAQNKDIALTNTSQIKPISTENNIAFLLSYGIDNQEWDNFLSRHIQQKIKNKNLIQAHRLASYLLNRSSYIDALGGILSVSKPSDFESDITTAIESKVSALSAGEQVQYFAQIGAYQLKAKSNNMFLSLAEKTWENISTPTEQLLSAIKLAVAYYKAGEMNLAQKHFNTINSLAYKIKPTEQKILTRIAISQAYKEVGADSLSLKWIVNAEKLMENTEQKNIQEFVKGYAYLNQIENVIRLIQQSTSLENQDLLTYQAIKVFLESSVPTNAIRLNDLLLTPVYKALSYTLLAAYNPKNPTYLALAETILNTEIHDTREKAIVSSRIAQLYARKEVDNKTPALLLFTKQQLTSLSSSSNKEKITNLVVINYLRSLNQLVARDLAGAIQSPQIKAAFNKAILNISEVKALIR